MSDIIASTIYYLTIFAAQIITAIFIEKASDFISISVPLKLILLQLFMLIIPTICYFKITKKDFLDEVPLAPLGLKTTILTVLFAIFIQPSMLLLSAITTLISPDAATALVNEMQDTGTMVSLLVIAVMPAIFEEIALRGVILSGYRKMPLIISILLNGLMFSILHFSIQQSLYTLAMGSIFAYLVHITKSVRTSILAHFLINGSQLLMARLILSNQSVVQIEVTQEIVLSQIIEYAKLALITLPIVIIIIHFISKR